jgi:Holliday junction resolvase-like predicted endonuclease
VLRRGRRLVFCEVKAKSDPRYDPFEMVGPEKVRRLHRDAETWLASHSELTGLEIRFEVVGIAGSRLRRVVLVP